MHSILFIPLISSGFWIWFWLLLLVYWAVGAIRKGVKRRKQQKEQKKEDEVQSQSIIQSQPLGTALKENRKIVSREEIRAAIKITTQELPSEELEQTKNDTNTMSSRKTPWSGSLEQLNDLLAWMSKQCDSELMRKSVAMVRNPLYAYRRDMGVGVLDYIEDSIQKRMKQRAEEQGLLAMKFGISLVEKMGDVSTLEEYKQWFVDKSWMGDYIPEVELTQSEIPVPYWAHQYVYSSEEIKVAGRSQREFYEYFKSKFLEGICLDVKGNTNYPFILLFDLRDEYRETGDYGSFKNRMNLLCKAYDITAKYAQDELEKVEVSFREKRYADTFADYLNKKECEAKWVPLQSDVEIHGRKMSRGGFYVGKYIPVPPEGNEARMLTWKSIVVGPVVDPDLPISEEGTMQTFSSYADMSPMMRTQYLSWLSGETDESEVSVDLLSCYLLGIEFRLFLDKSTGNQERAELVKYLIKLKERIGEREYLITEALETIIDNALARYFRNDWNSFLPHLTAYRSRTLIDAIITEIPKKQLSIQETVDLAWELFGLGGLLTPSMEKQIRDYAESVCKKAGVQSRRIRDFSPYPVNQNLLTPYSLQYGFDYYVKEQKDISYLVDDKHVEQYELKNLLWQIAGGVFHVVRSARIEAEKAGHFTVYSLFMLPEEFDFKQDEMVREFIENEQTSMDIRGQHLMKVNDFLSEIGYVRDDYSKIGKTAIDKIREGARICGFGIAPDLSLNEKRYVEGDWLCLYTLPKGDEERYDDKALALGRYYVRLAVSMVLADSPREEDLSIIWKYIASLPTVDKTKSYLLALYRFYTVSEQVIPRIQHPNDLDPKDKKDISDSLIRLLFSSGDISPKRMTVLKKYFEKLEIDPVGVHSRIHELMTTPEEETFATIEKVEGKGGFSIPGPKTEKKKFKMDEKRLEDVQKQTGKAQTLLSEIFVEEEKQDSRNTETEVSSANPVQEILSKLLTQDSWERKEVDAMCKEKGLMLGFVLEEINTLSFEKVDDAVVEDDGEMIYVTTAYKDQLI